MSGANGNMITKEVIVQEDELKILREFMRSKAGRTLDIRTIEGALILGILSQITHENSTTQHEERMAFGG